MNADRLREHIAHHRENARLLSSMDEALAGHHGIAWADLVLLDLLHAAGGRLPPGQAARDLGLTPSRLLLQVLPLEKLGLVTRGCCGGGERQLAIAAPGVRLLREAGYTADGVLAQQFGQR